MKVALCFIISYQHILNKEQLWIDWIKPNKDIINIYFHYKMDRSKFIRKTFVMTLKEGKEEAYRASHNEVSNAFYYYKINR